MLGESNKLMNAPRYPALYQINTHPRLTRLSRRLGRAVTLDDVPDDELDRLADLGFDWVWFRSVWQTGPAGRQISRDHPEWRREFEKTLPDLRDEDIAGSGFAITGYTIHQALGGDEALARLRARLQRRGLRLMLDFVPNHTALDHPWVDDHPEYYIPGTELDLARAPRNYAWIRRPGADRLLALGRDPYFPGWPDVLQLNYGNPDTREAMTAELLSVATKCDGVRCDMAMLVLPEVFERTWGIAAQPFWPEATRRVRKQTPGFHFMAEVYWDLEWTLLQQGFDHAYDKRLYDRLRDRHARPVREHLHAGLDYQDKLARFLENHDEPRAAAVFPTPIHQAAAIVTYLTPGLRFFQEGQFEGRTRHISPHLRREPDEPDDPPIRSFYQRLRTVIQRPAVRNGRWRLLECSPAWNGNDSADHFIAFAWEGTNSQDERLLVTVNHDENRSQCRVRLPFHDLAGKTWRLTDQTGDAVYDRDGDELQNPGLFLDMGAWNYHVFEMTARP